jgi:hypothetical protein
MDRRYIRKNRNGRKPNANTIPLSSSRISAYCRCRILNRMEVAKRMALA